MLKNLMLLLFTMSFMSSSFANTLKLTEGKYNIDPSHTRVSFTVDHMVVSEVEGRFNDVSGSFNLSEKVNNSTADVSVAIGSVDTGNSKRDEHLKGEDFFDAKKFPNMTFKSKKFIGSLNKFKVVGDLTIKDVTKQVTFEGKYTGSIKDPWGNLRAGIKASGKISRKEFNIKYNDMVEMSPAVGDEVTITILSEGIFEQVKK